MTKIGDIITDENDFLYAETAIWCNENNAYLDEIEPEGDIRRFKVKAVPEPTKEEKQNAVRSIRNRYLAETDKFMIADFPITEEEKEQYRSYRQFLRDYTKEEGWYEKPPMTFEEWRGK